MLAYRNFDKCIIAAPDTEKDAEKLKRCKATLAPSVEENLCLHLVNCKLALEIRTTLENVYEAKGFWNRKNHYMICGGR